MAWSMAEKAGSAPVADGCEHGRAAPPSRPDQTGVGASSRPWHVALILVDSGFSQTLIRKSDPTDDDYRSVFGLNLALAAVLYALCTAAAPWLSRASMTCRRSASWPRAVSAVSHQCAVRHSERDLSRASCVSRCCRKAIFVSSLVSGAPWPWGSPWRASDCGVSWGSAWRRSGCARRCCGG